MKYVQAVKPEKHNGGVFFEHEIHFSIEGKAAYASNRELVARIEQFITDGIGEKHSDFRVWVNIRYISPEGKVNLSPVRVATIKVRFVDKNKAFRFKLAWSE